MEIISSELMLSWSVLQYWMLLNKSYSTTLSNPFVKYGEQANMSWVLQINAVFIVGTKLSN